MKIPTMSGEELKMKITRTRLAIAVTGLIASMAVLLLIPGQGTAQTNPNSFIAYEVAYVNGETLTEPELLFTIIRMYGEETIYDLIEDEIIIGQADEMGVSLASNDVVEYLAATYTPEKLSTLLDSFGEGNLEDAIGTQLLALKVVTKKIDQVVTEHGIEVTGDQVQGFYLNNLPTWTTPKSVRFSLIETGAEAEAVEARLRIEAGEDFASVCQEVSTHPGTKAYGGDIGGLVPEGYSEGDRALLETTAFDLEIGDVSQPLLVEGKYYLVMLTEKTDYYEPSLEDMYDYIHAGLMDQLVQPHLEEWMMDLLVEAEEGINILYPIYTDDLLDSFSPGGDGSFISEIVVNVDDREITEVEFFFRLLRENGSAAIESLIEEILFVEQGQSMGVIVTAAETRESLQGVYDDESLSILDAAFGETVINTTFLRHLTALDVLGTKWQQIIEEHEIEITDEQILEYYLNNLHRWTRPDTVRFSIIIVEAEADAAAARTRIVSGESFEAVCMDVSQDDNTRAYGGDIGASVPRGAATGENTIMLDTAFELPIGGVSQPLEIGGKWFLIKTTEQSDAYEPSLAEMREEILGRLLEDRVTPFIMGWRSTIWTEADIEVVYPIYSDNPSPEF